MSQDSRKNSRPVLISDVLQTLLENGKSPLSAGFIRWRLEREWPQVVGESISGSSLPVGYDCGVLWVWVSHPGWIQHLRFFEGEIIKKVNAYLGYAYAQKVSFTLDRKAAVSDPTERK